eukprot:9957630-Alexandrium_andersonii.AAC.1
MQVAERGPGHLRVWDRPRPGVGLVRPPGPVLGPAPRVLRLHLESSEALGGQPDLLHLPGHLAGRAG